MRSLFFRGGLWGEEGAAKFWSLMDLSILWASVEGWVSEGLTVFIEQICQSGASRYFRLSLAYDEIRFWP